MSLRSAFLATDPDRHIRGERRFDLAFAGMLTLAALALLALPLPRQRYMAAFVASWLCLICLILALLRPAAYGKGVADVVLGLIAAFGYGFVGWLAGSVGTVDANGFRAILFAAFAFGGVARLLVFLRMLPVRALPMLAVAAAAHLIAAPLILLEIPAGSRMLWWYAGMLLLTDAADYAAQAAALRHFRPADARRA